MAATVTTRRVRVRESASCRVWAFGPSSTGWRSGTARCGWVLNDSGGGRDPSRRCALAECELGRAAGRADRRAAAGEPHRPTSSSTRRHPSSNHPAFVIRESARAGAPTVAHHAGLRDLRGLPRELFDPADRRYRYPFLNCTNCGPRLTIVSGVPYDRARTTMAAFAMCRRAGPSTTTRPTGASMPSRPHARRAGRGCGCVEPAARAESGDPLRRRRGGGRELLRGAIVAIKGLGGYHSLRRRDRAGGGGAARRKHRDEKPFALMVADLAAAARACELAPGETTCSIAASGRSSSAAAARVQRRRASRRGSLARRDAALHAAASPAAGRRGGRW